MNGAHENLPYADYVNLLVGNINRPSIDSQSQVTTDGQSVSPSWCRAPSGAHGQILITV
jgi:hypothetical protein